MITFRNFLLESGLIQDVPPDYNIQTWMNENRESFHKQHGKVQGERLLSAKAWQDYNSINSNSENLDTG